MFCAIVWGEFRDGYMGREISLCLRNGSTVGRYMHASFHFIYLEVRFNVTSIFQTMTKNKRGEGGGGRNGGRKERRKEESEGGKKESWSILVNSKRPCPQVHALETSESFAGPCQPPPPPRACLQVLWIQF